LNSIASLLIFCGADINVQDENFRSALSYLVSSTRNEKLVQAFLDHGATVRIEDVFSLISISTTYSSSIEMCHQKYLPLLLKYCPLALNAFFNGENLLMKTVKYGYPLTLKMLLDLGADFNEPPPNKRKNYLFMECLQICPARSTVKHNIARVLIAAGAEVVSKNDKEVRRKLISANDRELYQIICEFGVKNFDGAWEFPSQMENSHPVMQAILQKSPQELEEALKLDTNVNDCQKQLVTRIIKWEQYGVPEVMRFLTESFLPKGQHVMSPITYLMNAADEYDTESNFEMLKSLVQAQCFESAISMPAITALLFKIRVFSEEKRTKLNNHLEYVLKYGKVDMDEMDPEFASSLEGVEMLRRTTDLPDVLLAAFLTLNIGAILRLIQFWRAPPVALVISAMNNIHSSEIYLMLVKYLLPFGLPHGTQLFRIVQELLLHHPLLRADFQEYAGKKLKLNINAMSL